MKAIIVPSFKGKGAKDICSNYRGISVLSITGKVYMLIHSDRSDRMQKK